MTRRALLTLFSVLLVASIVTAISALYLRNQVDRQLEVVRERAESLARLAANAVARSLDKQPAAPVGDALASDPDLQGRLLEFLTSTTSLLEIAVCDPAGRILLSTEQNFAKGEAFQNYPDYDRLARNTTAWDKANLLFAGRALSNYQLTQSLEAEGEGVIVTVRAVVNLGLIRADIADDTQQALYAAAVSIAGSTLLAFLFSAYAFRPLTRVTRMLDMLTRGDYTPDAPMRPLGREDEFGAVLSKVDLLGQQLGNFERLLDDLEEAVLVFGPSGHLVVASGALDAFLGRKRGELMGLPMPAIFPPDRPLGLLLEQVAESKKPVRNIRVRLEGNEVKIEHALLSVEILETSAGVGTRTAGLLIRLRDPEARRQVQGQLQTAERLSAINRLTSGVAHEVKNPLNAILMHVELARMKMARGDNAVDGEMDIVSKEILRLDRVVKTFLDFARPAEIRIKEAPFDPFIDEIIELTKPQAAAAAIRIVTEFGAEGATIGADVDLLKQAVFNVVMNSIEAMPEGGELRFRTQMSSDDAEVSIADTGSGIPSELREKIFQLYFTTKVTGSGIGLAMTFRMVQLHGGKIEFCSEPGKGTTFTLRFPLAGSIA